MSKILCRLRTNPLYIFHFFHQKAHLSTLRRAMGAALLPNGKCQYDSHHVHAEDLPSSRLEHELIAKALGDCTDLLVLNLAGGQGDHARQALAAGASRVDVVDISISAMEIGEEIETQAGRYQIRWVLGDVSRPLAEQAIVPALPKQEYDLVLAIGAFDHAEDYEGYESVWKNVAAHLKPGGRVVASRMASPYSRALQTGKYGTKLKIAEQVSGGTRCRIMVLTDPPYSYETTSMEESLMGDKDLPEQLGLGEFKTLKAQTTDLVQRDPAFWKEFVEGPYFVVFTCKRKQL